MYNFIKTLAISFCLLTLTSCIELIDDLTLNSDGSGKFKYTIDISLIEFVQSKYEIVLLDDMVKTNIDDSDTSVKNNLMN